MGTRASLPLTTLLLLAPALLLAGPASATKMAIEFDLSGSSIALLGGAITIPPDGSITSASATVEVPATTTTSAQPGSGARLYGLSLDATLSASTLGLNITGTAGASQLGAANGTLTAGLGNLLFGAMLLDLSGLINCTGPGSGCAILGLPTTLSGVQSIPVLGTLGIGNVNTPGAATLAGVFSLTIGGFTAILDLVGTEVSRTFIPEPATGSLVALGTAVLAVARSRRRRR